jgi:hypothetical protein
MLAVLSAVPARADLRVSGFATYGDARARWVDPVGPNGDRSAIELFVRAGSSADFGDAAFVNLEGFRRRPPSQPPSFDFNASASGPGGGSPRLILTFGDGGKGHLRPARLVAGRWIHQDGSSDWDSLEGTCGHRVQLTYAAMLSCHPGTQVLSLEVLSDSGWLYPGGFRVLVDNISYGGETITGEASGVLGAVAESPKVGETVNVSHVSGDVEVRPPDSGSDFVTLSGINDVPVGSLVDARDGAVEISSAAHGGALQTGLAKGALFEVFQSEARTDKGLTELRLRGGSFDECPAAGRARASTLARGAVRRRIHFGTRHSHIGPRGRRASTRKARRPHRRRGHPARLSASRRTSWEVIDRCDGTLTVVKRGWVSVRDFARKRPILLGPGQKYLARIPRG